MEKKEEVLGYLPKAIGYIRVSTDSQDYERQRTEIIEYAKKYNFTIVKIFEDVETGSEYENRTGFQDMLLFLNEDNDVKIVIFDEVSRMGRDTGMQVSTYKQLTKRGVRIFTRGKGEFGNNKEDNLLFTILSAIADYEKQTIIDRTSSGRRKVVKDGFIQMSQRTFGYNLILNEKHDRKIIRRQYLEIHPDESTHVRKMFEIIDNGGTAYDILRYLKNKDVKPVKGGEQWGLTSVMRILHNTIYYGEWRFGKMVKNGKTKYSLSKRRFEDLLIVQTPSIIDKDLYNRVQEKIASRKTKFNPKNQKYIYLFKGLIKCNCERLLNCYFDKKGQSRLYRCSDHNIIGFHEKKCPVKSIKADYLEKVILIELKKKIGDKSFFKSLRELDLKDKFLDFDKLIQKVNSLNKRFKDQEVLLKKYYEESFKLMNSNLEKSRILEKMADDLLKDNQALKEQIDQIEEKIKENNAKKIDFDNINEMQKALDQMSQKDLEAFEVGDQNMKLHFVRKYIKSMKLRFLKTETEKLRSTLANLRKLGIYKRKNNHLKKLYLLAHNKNHQLRAKTAIQYLSMQVEFTNNYSIELEFPYFHEKPDMAISYFSEGMINLFTNKETTV